VNALSKFIAGQIVKQAQVSVSAGKEKYRAYFVSTGLYAAYRKEVDAALGEAGFAKAVVK